MSYKGPINRLFINTSQTNYTLTNEEIKNDPVIYFSNDVIRTVTLTFPATYDAGHTVDVYQDFEQGLGNIAVSASFQSPAITTFDKPDFIRLLTTPGNQVRLDETEYTVVATAVVSPSLFNDTVAGELGSYRYRYRMRVFNTGNSEIEVGLDNIDIETGWSGVSRYTLEITEQKYIPKASDGFLMQTVTWASNGGFAPEGALIRFDWTKSSDNTSRYYRRYRWIYYF